jgi:hypothetical protein
MNRVRDVLRAISPEVGVTFPHPDGQRFEKHTHVIWNLPYNSTFGPQGITVEVSLRPVLRPGRRAKLKQLLNDPLAGDYADAYCWALDEMEARAEKVRAACTRTAGRDFFDLSLLAMRDADLSSEEFLALVDRKLAELGHRPLKEHEFPFELTGERRKAVEASLERDLPAVVRLGERSLDLDALLKTFSARWCKS